MTLSTKSRIALKRALYTAPNCAKEIADAIDQSAAPDQVARFASTGNVVIASNNLSVVDGVTPVAGDIALLKSQDTASQNGLYKVVASGPWTRVKDGAGNAVVLTEGMTVEVAEGTSNAGKFFVLASDLTSWNSGVAASLSSATPAAVGASGSAGSGSAASKNDHVHADPLRAVAGTDVANDGTAMAIAQGNWRVLKPATLSANRSQALSVAGAVAGDWMIVDRFDLTDYTYTLTDAGPGTATLGVFPGGSTGTLVAQFDGTNWATKFFGVKHAAASATIPGTMSAAHFSQVATLGYRTLTLANADFAAGQGSGADTNGTARTYNLGAVIPAGATIDGYMAWRKTPVTGPTSLALSIGSTGQLSEIASAIDTMNGGAGYTQGTVGAKARLMPTATQLLATLTPDGGAKVSGASGEIHVTVWYKDATGL